MTQPPVTTPPVPDMPHAPPPAPALNALLIMAHVHGVAASGGDLLHRFAANGRDLQQEEWLLAARHLGLKARLVSSRVRRRVCTCLPCQLWCGVRTGSISFWHGLRGSSS